MKVIYGVYHNGKYLISNAEFSIDVDVLSGYGTFGPASIPTIMTYGSHKADVVYVDERIFTNIFNISCAQRDIIYSKNIGN